MIEIRKYVASDESNWVKCHFVSYYNSLYLDELHKIKPRYENPAIELVGLVDNAIIGILDIEVETKPGQFCSDKTKKSGLISILGVIPKYRKKGTATRLLKMAQNLLIQEFNVNRLEIWIREDYETLPWLIKYGFLEFQHFFEVKLTTDFFDRFRIEFPFDIFPSTFTGTLELDEFHKLSQIHAPETSFKIIGLEMNF